MYNYHSSSHYSQLLLLCLRVYNHHSKNFANQMTRLGCPTRQFLQFEYRQEFFDSINSTELYDSYICIFTRFWPSELIGIDLWTYIYIYTCIYIHLHTRLVFSYIKTTFVIYIFYYVFYIIIRSLHGCPSQMNENLMISNCKLTINSELIWYS